MLVERIASTIVIPHIKGEEFGICSIEFCGHVHFINIYSKMYQRPFFKLKQEFTRVSVLHVLSFGILYRLVREWIF